MAWLNKLYRDDEFFKLMESQEARRRCLATLEKRRTISLIAVAAALVALFTSWFSNPTIVIFFGAIVVNMDADQKVKWVKWFDKQGGRIEH